MYRLFRAVHRGRNDHDRDRDDCRDRIAFFTAGSYLQLQALPLSYFPWLVAIRQGI